MTTARSATSRSARQRLVAAVWLSVWIVLNGLLSLSTAASDLAAAADNQHLWLVTEDPNASGETGPRILIYHSSGRAQPGELTALDPQDGQLMPRAIAAGDNRLLIVNQDRQLITYRPVWSDLLKQYDYRKRSLARLPDGCTLVSLAIGSRGAWALVRVEDAQKFAAIAPAPKRGAGNGIDPVLLNRALGLPDTYRFDRGGDATEPRSDSKADLEAGAKTDADADTTIEASDEALPEDEPGEAVETDESRSDDAEPAGDGVGDDQAVRLGLELIHLQAGRWVQTPLPAEMPSQFKQAVLVMADSDRRPTLLVETREQPDAPAMLTRYRPIDSDEGVDGAELGGVEAQRSLWSGVAVRGVAWRGRPWAGAMVNGQPVLVIERSRWSDRLTVDAVVLRGDQTIRFGSLTLATQPDANWTASPWADGVALIATPDAPALAIDDRDASEPLGLLTAIKLTGEAIVAPELADLADPADPSDPDPTVTLRVAPRNSNLINADLYIQIGTFAVAMALMLGYYRRAPRPEQIDLPEHLMLASFGRRIMAGFVDLAPGFGVAALMYDTTINQTLQTWPGNGIPKVLEAMRPGFVVILVTVAHTTVAEIITARSIGKWVTGLYVGELTGRPAPPMRCGLRAVTRVFDLLAPLIFVVALISPARQRLGDILARTTVIMHKPPEPQDDPSANDDPY